MENIIELRTAFFEVMQELKPIFPEVMDIQYSIVFNTRAIKRYGQCKKLADHFFEISINKAFARVCDIRDVKNTIVHEILHSLPNGMTHKGAWKRYANTVNYKLPHYHITRTNSYEGYAEAKPDAKYVMYCPDCGREWKRYKKTEMITHILKGNNRRYHCPDCKTLVLVKCN